VGRREETTARTTTRGIGQKRKTQPKRKIDKTRLIGHARTVMIFQKVTQPQETHLKLRTGLIPYGTLIPEEKRIEEEGQSGCKADAAS
jgi:hypothetical protein